MTINVNPSSIPYWSVTRAYQLQGNVQPSEVESLLRLGVKSQINGTYVTIWYKDRGTVWDYEGRALLGIQQRLLATIAQTPNIKARDLL